MTPPKQRRMVLYARQSRYRFESESIPVQLEVCREAAPRLNIEIVATLIEKASAYKDRGRGRPEWKKMLKMIEAGEAEGALVYKSERLSRGGGPGYAPFWDACEKANLDLDYVVATAGGFESEFNMNIRATMDREESKKLAGRMIDIKAKEAQSGQKHRGGRRSFGYHRKEKARVNPVGELLPCPSCGSMDTEAICEAEASALRNATDRILSGESYSAITKDWRDRGLLTPTGKPWTIKDVAQTIRAPHLAGLRVHKGEVVAIGTWEPILDRATHEALKAGRATQPAPRRSYLLTGHIFCGLCGTRMKAHPSTRRGEPLRNYWCPGKTTGTGCGKVAVRADYVEPIVEKAVLGALEDQQVVRMVRRMSAGREEDADATRAVAELKAAERRLAEYAAEAHTMSPRAYAAATTAIEAEIKGLERRVARLAGESKALFTYAKDAIDEWEAQKDLTWRKAVVIALFEPIFVMPANAQSRGSSGRIVFDKDRVKIKPRPIPGDEQPS